MKTCECRRSHDNFIWQQGIAYLDWKYKRGSWQLHKNLAISIWSWALHHSKHVFYFQKASKINGIQVPCILGIQTPTQCQSMLGYDHIEKFLWITHLAQMMWNIICSPYGFDAHHTWVPLAWIITCRQTMYDWLNGFKPLKAKMLLIMSN